MKFEADIVAAGALRSRIKITVVKAVTTSSTNITGFFICVRGLSLTKAEPIARNDNLRIEECRYGLLWRSVDDSIVISPN